ncbi:DNA polymerase/3'-5' exonuclease PolX [bacterium]|nr:DNA polymerase/3'-5' exonuclease PolX [bacterium]
MENREIAGILEHIGLLLEIKGENPFKSRAYYNAARTISRLPFSVKNAASQDELKNIKGIGEALAKKIFELLSTGSLEYLVNLESEIPPGVMDMLQIPGLGAKKIHRIVNELGIVSVGELEYACRENRIRLLDGFGKKSQEKILNGIAFAQRFKGSILYAGAETIAKEIVSALQSVSGVVRVSTVGSLRRCMETVRSLDFLVAVDKAPVEKIVESIESLTVISKTLNRGKESVSVEYSKGFTGTILIVGTEMFPFALLWNTGSEQFITSLCAHVKEIGFDIREQGIYRDGAALQFAEENELFDVFGMEYIPPELRENNGEIEMALKHRLPELIRQEDLCGIFHVHTVWSDGSDTITGMAEAAHGMGMRYIGISDHSASAGYAGGLSVERVKAQWEEIDSLRDRDPGIYIFKGIESDIRVDGTLDYPDEILEGFDFVIASIHSRFTMDEDMATERIIRAISHPSVTMLGHPTGRLLLAREGYPVDMERILDACARNDVVIELNANPHRLDLDWRFLKTAASRGVMISINPDAHDVSMLSHIRFGINVARKGWITKESVFNAGTLEKVKNHFKRY